MSDKNITTEDTEDNSSLHAEKAAVQFFLDNAQPGTLKEIVEGCKVLLSPALSVHFVGDALVEAAERQQLLVPFNNSQAVLCEAGKQQKGIYLNTHTKQTMAVAENGGVLNVPASASSPDAFPPEVEPFRESLERELLKYAKKRYACGSLRTLLRLPVEVRHGVSVFSNVKNTKEEIELNKENGETTDTNTKEEEKEKERLVAVVSSSAENASSCWACTWTSEWHVSFSAAAAASSPVYLRGKARVRVHLHEDSSVQADFSREFELKDCSFPFVTNTVNPESTRSPVREGSPASVPPSAAASSSSEDTSEQGPHAEFARKVVHAIRQREEALSEEIENFAKNRAHSACRCLRRSLPLYGKDFDWKQQGIKLKTGENAKRNL